MSKVNSSVRQSVPKSFHTHQLPNISFKQPFKQSREIKSYVSFKEITEATSKEPRVGLLDLARDVLSQKNEPACASLPETFQQQGKQFRLPPRAQSSKPQAAKLQGQISTKASETTESNGAVQLRQRRNCLENLQARTARQLLTRIEIGPSTSSTSYMQQGLSKHKPNSLSPGFSHSKVKEKSLDQSQSLLRSLTDSRTTISLVNQQL